MSSSRASFLPPPPFSPFSPGLCQEWSLPPSIGSGPAARCVWCLGSARSVGVALQLLPLRGKEVWHRKTGGAPRAPPRLSRACAPGRGLGFCPLSVRQARSRFGVVTTTPRTASAAPPIGKSLYQPIYHRVDEYYFMAIVIFLHYFDACGLFVAVVGRHARCARSELRSERVW